MNTLTRGGALTGDQRSGRWAWAIRVALLAVALVLLAAPASAGAFLYWTNVKTDTIERANLDGTGVNPSFISGAKTAIGLALDSTNLFWTNLETTTLGRANLDGTGANQNFLSGPGELGLAVDGSHIYWTDFAAGTIGRANLDGTGAEPNFITGAKGPEGVAVDSGHLYWANRQGNAIGRANLDGSGVENNFIPNAGDPIGVAVDGAHIYWTDIVNTIGRANLDGGGVSTSFIVGTSFPAEGVAVDGSHIYWANLGTNAIGRANLDGSGADQSFIAAADPVGVAVDAVRDPSTTTLACVPATLLTSGTVACTATVTDGAAVPTAPTGAVDFSSSGVGAFTPTSRCSLVASGGASAACQVTYATSTLGKPVIAATYAGDSGHLGSDGSASLDVLAPPPPKPANSFRLAKPKLNKKTGTATLAATVPGPGKLILTGKGIRRQSKLVARAGKVTLTVMPAGRAKQRLRRTGRATVTLKIDYTPNGGDPRNQALKLTLRLAD